MTVPEEWDMEVSPAYTTVLRSGPAEESREADCLRSAARTAEAAVSPAASKAGTCAAVRTADDEKRAANQRSPYGMPATAGQISRRGNLFVR